MTKLSVNINKFALIRNARGNDFPNIIKIATRCINAGAHGITIHPRPDERHAKYSDAYELSTLLKSYPGIEFNIEGNPIPKFLKMVKEVKPDQCTLVPDSPDQLTSDHGWDVIKEKEQLIPVIRSLQEADIRVSIFLDPDIKQVEKAKETKTDRIELYTESYARTYSKEENESIFLSYKQATQKAQELGLGINAGHDLNQQNLGYFLTIPNIAEVSIGHAIIVESFDHGLEETIKRYLKIIENAEK